MTFSATSRSVVRTVARRQIDWSAPVLRSDPELAAKVMKFRAWVANADKMAETYAKPPPPIDFAAASAKVRDTDIVSTLETLYKNSTIPPEVHTWDEADKAAKLQLIEEAKVRREETSELIVETEKEIEFRKSTRTTRDTSVGQIKEYYPEIAAEVDKEIENREWFKDTLNK